MKRRYKREFGLDHLDDIASLPSILLFLNVSLLLLLPAYNAFLRHQEHETDRFALELTHDNHAAGPAFVKLTQGYWVCHGTDGSLRHGGIRIPPWVIDSTSLTNTGHGRRVSL
jgi:hypothetical protein